MVQHERGSAETTTTTWLTPLAIITSLGTFDLDPATPPVMPWKTAAKRYTEKDDGLAQPWAGRVWMNPPYGAIILPKWMKKLAEHGNGIALIPARMEIKAVHEFVFPLADGIFFPDKRIQFLDGEGNLPEKARNGVGSMFIAYGKSNVKLTRRPLCAAQILIMQLNETLAGYARKGAALAGPSLGSMCDSCAFRLNSAANLEEETVEAAFDTLAFGGVFHCHKRGEDGELGDAGHVCAGFAYAKRWEAYIIPEVEARDAEEELEEAANG